MSIALLRRMLRQAIAIVTIFALCIFITLPSDAASMSSSVSAEERLDRAYEETEAAGIQEEIYQQRLQEGQNPEKMPKPYKRIVDAEGKEVPETSLIETSVSKIQQLTKKIAGE